MDRPFSTIAIAAVAVGIVAAANGAVQSPSTADPVRQFDQRVAAYMKLHHQIEAPLLPLRANSDAAQIQRAVAAMASAMRAARAGAHTGDIFTKDIAEAFRARIADAMRTKGYAATELLAAIEEETGPPSSPLAINEPLPSGLSTMPPVMLQALPRLPSELQYRFVGTDLVLVDIHSSLVVDVLRQALQVN
jgi:hypothetical protein